MRKKSGKNKNSETSTYYTSGGRLYGPEANRASIENGKEIVLYRSLFSDKGGNIYNAQEYAERPELLEEFPYAHIIKCKFYN
ncbi:hypothetical protein [Desulforamulus ruminis]|nr:hypothetical protein [Desulforamulus ruminis]